MSIRDIELRHLRYFIAVAEELHFGRAARRLFLSQPSLSYAIGQLEDRLGCQLVDRSDRRRIVLTRSGEALLAHAREIDGQVHEALTSVQRTETRAGKQLRVGYNDGEPLAQRPSALRAAMRDASLTVSFRRLSWGSEATMLRRREVDVLLARLPIDCAGLSMEVVHAEPRMLCVPKRHRFAKRRTLSLKDLRRIPIVNPQGGSEEWRAYWRGLPDGEGITGPEVHSPEETFDVVASGKAACFVPASMVVEGDEAAVRYVEVPDIAPSELAVVWKGRRTATLRGFVSAVRGLVGG